MPAFNEAPFIGPVIEEIRKNCGDADVLVVDDGSKDGTSSQAHDRGALVINHPFNLGYGAALQTGFKFAVKKGYDYVVTIDADGQHDPASVQSLFESLKSAGADVVVGSRFLTGTYRMSVARRIGAWLFALVARFYTGYRFTDPTSGFQLLNRAAFLYLAADEGYPFDYPDVNIIMLLHKKRFKVVEAPVRMSINEEGDTMHSGLKPFLYVVRMFLAIMIVLLRKED